MTNPPTKSGKVASVVVQLCEAFARKCERCWASLNETPSPHGGTILR